jgi:hypothetical protein
MLVKQYGNGKGKRILVSESQDKIIYQSEIGLIDERGDSINPNGGCGWFAGTPTLSDDEVDLVVAGAAVVALTSPMSGARILMTGEIKAGSVGLG